MNFACKFTKKSTLLLCSTVQATYPPWVSQNGHHKHHTPFAVVKTTLRCSTRIIHTHHTHTGLQNGFAELYKPYICLWKLKNTPNFYHTFNMLCSIQNGFSSYTLYGCVTGLSEPVQASYTRCCDKAFSSYTLCGSLNRVSELLQT